MVCTLEGLAELTDRLRAGNQMPERRHAGESRSGLTTFAESAYACTQGTLAAVAMCADPRREDARITLVRYRIVLLFFVEVRSPSTGQEEAKSLHNEPVRYVAAQETPEARYREMQTRHTRFLIDRQNVGPAMVRFRCERA